MIKSCLTYLPTLLTSKLEDDGSHSLFHLWVVSDVSEGTGEIVPANQIHCPRWQASGELDYNYIPCLISLKSPIYCQDLRTDASFYSVIGVSDDGSTALKSPSSYPF
jgi:hypothetical protein